MFHTTSANREATGEFEMGGYNLTVPLYGGNSVVLKTVGTNSTSGFNFRTAFEAMNAYPDHGVVIRVDIQPGDMQQECVCGDTLGLFTLPRYQGDLFYDFKPACTITFSDWSLGTLGSITSFPSELFTRDRPLVRHYLTTILTDCELTSCTMAVLDDEPRRKLIRSWRTCSEYINDWVVIPNASYDISKVFASANKRIDATMEELQKRMADMV